MNSATAPALTARAPGFDGLRGEAALMVFAYHLRWIAGEPVLTFGGADLGADSQQV